MAKGTRRSEATRRRGHRDRSSGGEGPAGGGPVRVSLVSLGCAKNLVDSELILGSAGAAGLAITASPRDADVIVINTCGFIGPAREESMGAILEACALKTSSPTPKKVVVTGCLAQRYGEEIRRDAPQVDAIVGLGQYGGIAELLRGLAGDEEVPRLLVADPNTACNAEVGRLRLTPPHYAYLRISEGCDNPCTFCAIPGMRGRFRSKPLPEIEVETRELVASGAEEIVLISQDTTSYGLDLDGRHQLPQLLERVASVEGVRWVRVLYVYPSSFSDEMIDAVARTSKVLKYIDIPIQHIDDRMLRRMGRKTSESYTRGLLAHMRERIPGLYLRTTFLVGFPGEGEEEFQRLIQFVREFGFERMGVFTYSREEGTPAARMTEELPAEELRRRREELMLAQQEVAFAQNRRRVGEVCEAVVDGREGGQLYARSHGEAPEIDPRIFLPRSPAGLRMGEFLDLEITGTRAYDLIARPHPHAGR